MVVGAGSAGCVLANRLTEDQNTKVLLLEAGPKDTFLGSRLARWKVHMPAALTYNLSSDKMNWFYHTVPQRHVNNRVRGGEAEEKESVCSGDVLAKGEGLGWVVFT